MAAIVITGGLYVQTGFKSPANYSPHLVSASIVISLGKVTVNILVYSEIDWKVNE